MENDMIIIPDVHGRTFWKDVVKGNEDKPIIFLGDYVDPYKDEGVNYTATIDNFKEILKFKRKHKKNVILLLGNHDLSYVLEGMPKVRYDYMGSAEIKKLFKENIDFFKILHEETINGKRYIFSHSGVLPKWLDIIKQEDGFDTNDEDFVNDINDLLKDDERMLYLILYRITWRRGGWDNYSSCVWGDVGEYIQYIHEKDRQFENVFQIFAHTRMTNPLISEDYACLDARRGFILNKEGEITEIKTDGE